MTHELPPSSKSFVSISGDFFLYKVLFFSPVISCNSASDPTIKGQTSMNKYPCYKNVTVCTIVYLKIKIWSMFGLLNS